MSSWVFIVVRNNVVEQVSGFRDYWTGCLFADNFIWSIDRLMVGRTMPAYNKGETYKKDDLSVGLYKT